MATATATATVKVTAIASAPLPVKHVSPKDDCSVCFGRAWKVYTNSMEEGGNFLKSVFRLTNATTFWAKFFNPSTPQSVTDVGAFAKQAKNLVSIFGIPSAVQRVWDRFAHFDFNKPVKSAVDLGADVCSLANTGCDTAEFVSEVATPLPKEVMAVVKPINYTATFLGSLKGSYDVVVDLTKNVFAYRTNEEERAKPDSTISDMRYEDVRTKTTQQVISNVLSLASKVAYVALGAVGFAAIFTPIAPAAIVACLTAGTVLGLTHFFYDRVVDPNDKHAKNLSKHFLFDRATELGKVKTA